jgi:hypothetical protein
MAEALIAKKSAKFDLGKIAPDYNVAPQTMQPGIVWEDRQGMRTLHMMFWRFLPR